MTISNQASQVTVEGNGVTTAFTFQFLIPSADDLVVQVTDGTVDPTVTTDLLSSQFSVTGINDPNGGVVTYPLSGSPISAGFFLSISRILPIVQERSIRNQGNFYPAVVEAGLDYLTMVCQQLQAQLTALEAGESPFIPPDDALTVVANISDLRNLAAAAGMSVFVQGYYDGGDAGSGTFFITSSSPGTDNGGTFIDLNTVGLYGVRQLVGSIVTPEMFGAIGDGVANDTTPLQNFAIYVSGTGAFGIFAPGATYLKVARPTFTGAGFTLEGNGATIKTAAGATASKANATCYFVSASDFMVRNLNFDGNRDNRTPDVNEGISVYMVSIDNFMFENCQSINACTDNWYLGPTNGASASTFPSNGLFLNCIGDNAYRNNMSLIDCIKVDVIGGSYSNANGTAPQSGIDIEPNPGADDPGVYAVTLNGVYANDNAGYQVQVGADGPPRAVFIDNLTVDGSNVSGAGGFKTDASDLFLTNFVARNFSGITTTDLTRIIVAATSGCRVMIRGAFIDNCSGDKEGGVVVLNDAVGYISDIIFKDCVAGALLDIDNSTGIIIEGFNAVSSGQSVTSFAGMLRLQGHTIVSNAMFTSCSGMHVDSRSSSSAIINGMVILSPTLTTQFEPGVVRLAGHEDIDNLIIATPNVTASNFFGLYVTGTPKRIGYLDISGFSAGSAVSFTTGVTGTILTTTTSVTCGMVTELVIFGGSGNRNCTLPQSTNYTDRTIHRVDVANEGTTGTITVNVFAGDSITGTTGLVTGSSSGYMLDVVTKTWHAIT